MVYDVVWLWQATIHAGQRGHHLYVLNVTTEICTFFKVWHYQEKPGNENMQPYILWKIQKLEILDTLHPFPHFIDSWLFRAYGVHSSCFCLYTPRFLFEAGKKTCIWDVEAEAKFPKALGGYRYRLEGILLYLSHALFQSSQGKGSNSSIEI